MKSFQIENLRLMDNTRDIDINSCNLFLGANGSGKSTILRLFPLIKQTVTQKNNVPLLWYDKDGVDLGSYSESVRMSQKNNGISLGFNLNKVFKVAKQFVPEILVKEFANQNHFFFFYFSFHNDFYEITIQNIKVKICDDKFKELSIEIDNYKIDFDFENNKVTINEEIVVNNEKLIAKKNDYSFLPSIYIQSSDGEQKKLKSLTSVITKKFIKKLFSEAHRNMNADTKRKILSKIKYSKTFDEFIEQFNNIRQKTVSKLFLDNQKIAKELFNLFLLIHCSSLIAYIDEVIVKFFKSSIYVAPIRATAERFYRIQGLSVDEVDSRGSNVPMMLDNMRANNLEEHWQKWTMENFGTKYRVKSSLGNVSVEVFIDGDYYNLADTGFGYSQFLPILLLIWKKTQVDLEEGLENRNDNLFLPRATQKVQYDDSVITTIIIEQPELHLHPRMQSQFADLLFNIIRQTDDVKFIIETHSVAIINRLGDLIEDTVDSDMQDKFNIYLVNRNVNENDERIQAVRYDDNGIITGWPVGFL